MHMKLIIFVMLLLVVAAIFLVGNVMVSEYERCYAEQEYKGIAAFGNCCGLADGTAWTDGLCEFCINCPHLCFVSAGSEKGDSDEKNT